MKMQCFLFKNIPSFDVESKWSYSRLHYTQLWAKNQKKYYEKNPRFYRWNKLIFLFFEQLELGGLHTGATCSSLSLSPSLSLKLIIWKNHLCWNFVGKVCWITCLIQHSLADLLFWKWNLIYSLPKIIKIRDFFFEFFISKLACFHRSFFLESGLWRIYEFLTHFASHTLPTHNCWNQFWWRFKCMALLQKFVYVYSTQCCLEKKCQQKVWAFYWLHKLKYVSWAMLK